MRGKHFMLVETLGSFLFVCLLNIHSFIPSYFVAFRDETKNGTGFFFYLHQGYVRERKGGKMGELKPELGICMTGK